MSDDGFTTAAVVVQEPGALTPRTFEKIRKLIYDKAGIDLRQGKQTLVAARLGKKMRESGLRDYDAYLDSVMADKTGDSMIALIDALTTNYTSFWREPQHFHFLRDEIVPTVRNKRQIDIWCAAASTGEEPYTLAFSMLDALGPAALTQVRILATDISTRALAAATKAIYPSDRLQGAPKQWLSRYCSPGQGQFQGFCQVRSEIRRMIQFRRLNLIESFAHPGTFPLISCRNVMIYFDKSTQQSLVNRMANHLEPGGHLFIGHAESLSGVEHGLRFIAPAIYQRQAGGSNEGTRQR
ncbi:MAG TPA: protein-glutamate O-methyltransferase CheR [Bryobacteraceae bacterium]|jgi:chemotaxis protein methyltransferase CheR